VESVDPVDRALDFLHSCLIYEPQRRSTGASW
jgi:hypothetical protein